MKNCNRNSNKSKKKVVLSFYFLVHTVTYCERKLQVVQTFHYKCNFVTHYWALNVNREFV